MSAEDGKKDFIPLRLPKTQEGEIIRVWLESLEEKSLKKFNQSDAIREAIIAYIMGVSITFDPQDPRDQRIIQEIRHLEDEPRRMSEWIKARLWERLTGLDSITGEPLPQFVKVIETQVAVVSERVTFVDKPVYIGTAQPEAAPTPQESNLNEEAYREADELEW